MSLPRYFGPLRNRDFALLWSGQAVSQLGDGVFTVTLALEHWASTGTPPDCRTCWLPGSSRLSCSRCLVG